MCCAHESRSFPFCPASAHPVQVAPSREVLIGVSNVNPLREGMLDTFLSGVKQAGVTSYLIVALDQETASDLTARGFNAFYMPLQVGRRVYACRQVSVHAWVDACVRLGSRQYPVDWLFKGIGLCGAVRSIKGLRCTSSPTNRKEMLFGATGRT